MAGLTLFAQNLLEAATISSDPGDAAEKLGRLVDRAQSIPWTGPSGWGMAGMFPIAMGMGTPASWIIDVDLGASPSPVTGLALVNQNITGVSVTLKADDTSPPTTTRDTFDPAGATHVLRTFASLTKRYWRLTIPAPATAPSIGEILLGVPRVITESPSLASAARAAVGNRRVATSPAGYQRRVSLGAPRTRLAYAWNGLGATDETARAAAYSDSHEGALPLLVKDELDVLRWMAIEDEESVPVPVKSASSASDRLYAVRLTLVEALL